MRRYSRTGWLQRSCRSAATTSRPISGRSASRPSRWPTQNHRTPTCIRCAYVLDFCRRCCCCCCGGGRALAHSSRVPRNRRSLAAINRPSSTSRRSPRLSWPTLRRGRRSSTILLPAVSSRRPQAARALRSCYRYDLSTTPHHHHHQAHTHARTYLHYTATAVRID